MTYQEIVSSKKDMLTPNDIAPVLGCGAQTIRVSARQRPDMIPFPFVFLGTRMKIPRLAFIAWMTHKTEEDNNDNRTAEEG